MRIMERKKKGYTACMVTGTAAGMCLLFLIAFYVNKAFLTEGMMYRAGVEIAGAFISRVFFPLLLYAFIWCLAGYRLQEGRFETARLLIRILLGIALAIYLVIAVLWTIGYGFNVGTEEEIAPGILRTSSDILGEYYEYSYEKEQGILYKSRYEPMSDIALLLMEQKYSEDFVLALPEEEENTWILAPSDNPDNLFTVWRNNDVSIFLDDYPIMRAAFQMKKEAESLCPKREILVEKSDNGHGKGLEVVCADKADAGQCAQDVAGLIAKALEDDFFRKEDREITLNIICTYNDNTEKVALHFGNWRNAKISEDNPYDYYTDADLIYKKLFYVWDELGNQALEDALSQEEQERGTGGSAEEEWDALRKQQEASPYYVEGAYKALYEELFAAREYPYNTGYTAKGNFYGWLCEGVGTLESAEGAFEYQETVVYDRESKNGKCHLFVHYRTYYQDGSEYTTAILDMYAVDMATGTVYTSGRHAWADVGTKEYCDATGEP